LSASASASVSVCTSPALGKFSATGISESVVGVGVVGLLVSGRAEAGASAVIGFDVAGDGDSAASGSVRVFIGVFALQAAITVAATRLERLVLRKWVEQVLQRRRRFMIRYNKTGHAKYIGFIEQT